MDASLLSGTFYHGTARRNLAFSPDRPAYLSPEKGEAEIYAAMDAEIEGGTPTVLAVRIFDPVAAILPTLLMQDLHLAEHDSLVSSLVAEGYNCAISNGPDNAEAVVFGGVHLVAA